jgi:hypothetical protein
MFDNICNGEYNTNRGSPLEITSVCEKVQEALLYSDIGRGPVLPMGCTLYSQIYYLFECKLSDYRNAIFRLTSAFKVFCSLLKEGKRMFLGMT